MYARSFIIDGMFLLPSSTLHSEIALISPLRVLLGSSEEFGSLVGVLFCSESEALSVIRMFESNPRNKYAARVRGSLTTTKTLDIILPLGSPFSNKKA